MSDEPNIRFIRFKGDKTGGPVVHAPGLNALLIRCDPALVGAAIYRVHENVTCIDCILLMNEGEQAK